MMKRRAAALWIVIAPLEFIATLLVAAVLWAFAAIYLGLRSYAQGLSYATRRASAVWKHRVARGREVFAPDNVRARAANTSKPPGEQRSRPTTCADSWLN